MLRLLNCQRIVGIAGHNYSITHNLQRIFCRKSGHRKNSGTQQHETKQYAEVPFGFAHLHHLFFSQEPSVKAGFATPL